MDSESLARLLAPLYPPASSPTVLLQVLGVADACYRGDRQRCLLDFLLPARRLLLGLQGPALPPPGPPPGWPLSLQEKLVVQLCPLDPLLLRPGDFYLLVAPPATPPPDWPAPAITPSPDCPAPAATPPPDWPAGAPCGRTAAPRLLLCSRAAGGRHAERQPVAGAALGAVFSMAWLDAVNRERQRRGAAPLRRCLLADPRGVSRVPWEDLVYPQLRAGPPLQELRPPPAHPGQSAASGEDSEGEYVELVELPRFGPHKGSLTQSISQQNRARTRRFSKAGSDTPTLLLEEDHCSSSAPQRPKPPGGVGPQPRTGSEQGGEEEQGRGEDQRKGEEQMEERRTEEGQKEQRRGEEQRDEKRRREEEQRDELREQEEQRDELREQEEQRDELRREEEEQQRRWEEQRDERRKNEEQRDELGREEEEQRDGSGRRSEAQRGEEWVSEDQQVREEKRWGKEDGEQREEMDVVERMGGGGTPEEGAEEEEVKVTATKQNQEGEEVQLGGEEQGGASVTERAPSPRKPLEEQRCEEAAGGRSEEPPAEEVDQPGASGPAEPEPPAVQSPESSRSRFYSLLLRSGAVCLPGTRDRGGAAVLTACCSHAVWSDPDCHSAELLRLLLYYSSTLSEEVRALGLTVLLDARRAAPAAALFSALWSLQEDSPGSIRSVLILVSKDWTLRVDQRAAQVEVLSSLKSLQKHVDVQQLPAELGGSFIFNQSSWLSFRGRVERLTSQCQDAIDLLQKAINVLQSTPVPAATQDAELLLSGCRAVMSGILADSRLVQLQQEGGASLAWLRREEGGASGEQRAALAAAAALYEQVDELLHRLVTLSNTRTQELRFMLDFRRLEQDFSQVTAWLEQVGEPRLQTLEEPADSLERCSRNQQDFRDFQRAACDQCQRAEVLLARLDCWEDVSSADLHVYEVKVHAFWARMQDFSERVNRTGKNIERAVRLHSFLDQASGWALEAMRCLAGVSMEDCTAPDKCSAVIGCLEDYQRSHPPIPEELFQLMMAEASELLGERGVRQLGAAQSSCQEVQTALCRRLEVALRTRGSAHRRRSDSAVSRSSSWRTLSGLWGGEAASSSPAPPRPLLRRLFRSSSEESADRLAPPPSHFSSSPDQLSPPPSRFRSSADPLAPPLFHIGSSPGQVAPPTSRICSSPDQLTPSPSHLSSFPDQLARPIFHVGSSPDHLAPPLPRLSSSPSLSPLPGCRRQLLRKTQSLDSGPEASRLPAPALSEPARRGNTGVFIRGLEVSSTEAASRSPRSVPYSWAGDTRTPPHSWAGDTSPRTPATPDPTPRLCHIVEEMVTTEREYVRSLRYVLRHYVPELQRADLPQGLRGQRAALFGNLEKLLDFHSQFFLRELEACWKHPLRAPHCFLRHQEQFGLYALYSRNKPRSDTLLAAHGHAFFRRKQLELGDKLDLSSYLLKPIQRMGKYALLLTDLMREVGGAQEAELTALQAATSMVKFQLRHGNDLLAMDAIRDCDVNLKEQGQLIRQDEFTVCSGLRKCQRRVFLFEELVLFSKPKKVEGGLDVFLYKLCFKTSDVGLTESSGDGGRSFELWIRRRSSRNQSFILQASTADAKRVWTQDLTRILWGQATRSKGGGRQDRVWQNQQNWVSSTRTGSLCAELRLKELLAMGVGSRPLLDLQPSEAAISDRAVNMTTRGARTRSSIAVSAFDQSHPFRRGALTSDPTAAVTSSSTLLGPLDLHLFRDHTHLYSQSLPASPADSSFGASCIEEDEQEHETSSQPSLTTESSGSSSRGLSGSTGSDSGCVSSHLQEAPPEEPPHSGPCSSNQLLSGFDSPRAAPAAGPATAI
ncbi:puratrophin-1 isoform 2-T2 [Menidia menidia]